ncbi:hypothetical protein AB0903_09060 [Streptomyces sp. NPDC048389]|uniref:hypothetical protein n=1 Tax=Streptomyces sp. NPDC048389 TaxID=3154622 RepID=UPI003452791A
MKVRMLRLMCNPTYGNHQPGAEIELPDDVARKRIANGDCVAVDAPKASRLLSKLGARRKKGDPPAAPKNPQDVGEKPLEQMKLDELTAYAAEHDIDLGDAMLKADVLRVVAAAVEARRDQDEDED